MILVVLLYVLEVAVLEYLKGKRAHQAYFYLYFCSDIASRGIKSANV